MKNEQRMLYNEFYILARDSILYPCACVCLCVAVSIRVIWIFDFERGTVPFLFLKKKADTKFVEKKIEGESDADADKNKTADGPDIYFTTIHKLKARFFWGAISFILSTLL